MCQGKMKFYQNVRELSGNFAFPVMNIEEEEKNKTMAVFLTFGIQA